MSVASTQAMHTSHVRVRGTISVEASLLLLVGVAASLVSLGPAFFNSISERTTSEPSQDGEIGQHNAGATPLVGSQKMAVVGARLVRVAGDLARMPSDVAEAVDNIAHAARRTDAPSPWLRKVDQYFAQGTDVGRSRSIEPELDFLEVLRSSHRALASLDEERLAGLYSAGLAPGQATHSSVALWRKFENPVKYDDRRARLEPLLVLRAGDDSGGLQLVEHGAPWNDRIPYRHGYHFFNDLKSGPGFRNPVEQIAAAGGEVHIDMTEGSRHFRRIEFEDGDWQSQVEPSRHRVRELGQTELDQLRARVAPNAKFVIEIGIDHPSPKLALGDALRAREGKSLWAESVLRRKIHDISEASVQLFATPLNPNPRQVGWLRSASFGGRPWL